MALEFREADELVVQAELPGLHTASELEIWISKGVLHLRARAEGPDEAVGPSDLRDGEFTRDIAVSAGAGPGARASYDGARLEVRVPLVDGVASAGCRVAVELRPPAPRRLEPYEPA